MKNTNLTRLIFYLSSFLVDFGNATPLPRQVDSSTSTYSTRFENVTWDNEAWQLTTTNLDQGHYQSRISLANGYIGINVAALGPFFEYDQPVNGDVLNGWPLFNRRQTFATVGGFWDSQPDTNGSNFPWLYQYGWDTAISGIPHWSGILLEVGDATLNASTDASEISDFTSSIDMKHSLMSWAYTWSPPSGSPLSISYQMFLHKVNVTQAYISLNITAQEDMNVTVINALDGDCATRATFKDKGTDGDFIYSVVSPNGLMDIEAFIYANMSFVGGSKTGNLQSPYDGTAVGRNESSNAAAQNIALTSGETVTVYKYVGIASSDAFDNPQDIARMGAQQAMTAGYADSIASHRAEWEELFPASSVDDYSFENGTLPDDDYLIEAQIMAVANPFYLLQQTISESAQNLVGNASINSHSIAVGGLGSDSYAGQIFWDAEVWMQPGLVATFPYAARGIANYRIERYAQAQANVETAYQSSKNQTEYSREGAVFPWTSGRFGNCTATGPCWDYEYHLNGDIGLEFINYWITSGDTDFFKQNLLPIYNSIAITFSEILEQNGSSWALTNMTDPDEFANHVDNGGFTMPLIAETLSYANQFNEYFGNDVNDTWSDQAENVAIFRNEDANIILEFSDMNGTVNVKQADVVLVTYPLSYAGQDYDTEDSLSDLNYYANKQSPDGPAMTYGIFSIVANEASPSGCSAYTYQQYSTQPYVRAPWFQLSEQLTDNFEVNGGFHPAYPFLTGHGGANQVVLFGYLGLRLIPDWVLHIDPSLPPQIPQIKYRTFYWQGLPISAHSNQTHTTLSRIYDGPIAAGVVPNSSFVDIPVAVGSVNGEQQQYTLPANGSLTVPNRQIGNVRSVANNLAQCQAAVSEVEVVPGQFAISAVDGAASTKWQPEFANETAQITIELEVGHEILGFRFEWADAPAYNYSIWLHNDSASLGEGSFGTATAQMVVEDARVEISEPWDPESIAEIRQPGTNVSALWLNGTQSFTSGDLQVDGGLWSSRFVTLAIWGSLYNDTLTAENMTGDGATVAEFNVIVDGLD